MLNNLIQYQVTSIPTTSFQPSPSLLPARGAEQSHQIVTTIFLLNPNPYCMLSKLSCSKCDPMYFCTGTFPLNYRLSSNYHYLALYVFSGLCVLLYSVQYMCEGGLYTTVQVRLFPFKLVLKWHVQQSSLILFDSCCVWIDAVRWELEPGVHHHQEAGRLPPAGQPLHRLRLHQQVQLQFHAETRLQFASVYLGIKYSIELCARKRPSI